MTTEENNIRRASYAVGYADCLGHVIGFLESLSKEAEENLETIVHQMKEVSDG